MTIIIPWHLGMVLIGILTGWFAARVWVSFCAYCNTLTPPRWIPWRRIPCDDCIAQGIEIGRHQLERQIQCAVTAVNSLQESNAEGGC